MVYISVAGIGVTFRELCVVKVEFQRQTNGLTHADFIFVWIAEHEVAKGVNTVFFRPADYVMVHFDGG